MSRVPTAGPGSLAFAVAYLGLVVVCFGTGELLTGSTDAFWPSPLAWAVALGWIPALAIGAATRAATQTGPARTASRVLLGVVAAEVVTLAVLHFAYRIGDTPETVRERLAAEARVLAPGDVTAYLARPGAPALERDAALYALAAPDVWHRLAAPDGLAPDDAAAIEGAVLARLDRAPNEGAAHALLSALAADRLRRARLAGVLARWPAHAHDVLTAAAARPELVLDEHGCLAAADQDASRALAVQRITAEPRAARRWLRWLAWTELRCPGPGRIAGLLAACDGAPDDRAWCEGLVLKELSERPPHAVVLAETDRASLAAVATRLAVAEPPAQRRLGASTELWLAKQALAPGRVPPVLAAADRLEAQPGPFAVHTLRWLSTPPVAARFTDAGGRIDDADLAALGAATEAAVAAGRLRGGEAERLRLWIARQGAVARADTPSDELP